MTNQKLSAPTDAAGALEGNGGEASERLHWPAPTSTGPSAPVLTVDFMWRAIIDAYGDNDVTEAYPQMEAPNQAYELAQAALEEEFGLLSHRLSCHLGALLDAGTNAQFGYGEHQFRLGMYVGAHLQRAYAINAGRVVPEIEPEDLITPAELATVAARMAVASEDEDRRSAERIQESYRRIDEQFRDHDPAACPACIRDGRPRDMAVAP